MKDRYLLWRALTMDMVKAVHNQEARYTVEYVAGLLNRKLGPFFQPEIYGRTRDDLQRNVDELARLAVRLDWYARTSLLSLFHRRRGEAIRGSRIRRRG